MSTRFTVRPRRQCPSNLRLLNWQTSEQFLKCTWQSWLTTALCLVSVACGALHASHYGDPKSGCLADERNVTIDGVAGDLCAPICHPNATVPCPTDVPPGVTAKPACELTFKDGGKGCVLVCAPMVDAALLRAGDAQCGAGSCQPIQGVGVCTYGAPPPTGLPAGCEATGARVVCTGNASPEPGCERINRLCCFNQLDDTFAALQRYRKKNSFAALSLGCSGNFGGGDDAWAQKFGSLLKGFAGLRLLDLDLSLNQAGKQDSILDAVEPALAANPGLEELSLNLAAANISDDGASRLGAMLRAHFKGSHLSANLGESDPSDVVHTTPITSVGAGEFSASVGKMTSLKNLSLQFRFDMNITAHGIARIAVGLEPLQGTLQFLSLDFGYMDNKDPIPSGYPPDFACLGRVLGGFQRLTTLTLNLDGDVGDPEVVRALGLHLSCLPVSAMPMLDNDGCHCGLKVDKARGCIVPNQYYSGDLGTGCFRCTPSANATSCTADASLRHLT
eukprot:m.123738 g.123738  ORF g.123738 m.123738 type:complete len:504 (+) comp13471_c0_seq1:171-1682(+)